MGNPFGYTFLPSRIRIFPSRSSTSGTGRFGGEIFFAPLVAKPQFYYRNEGVIVTSSNFLVERCRITIENRGLSKESLGAVEWPLTTTSLKSDNKGRKTKPQNMWMTCNCQRRLWREQMIKSGQRKKKKGDQRGYLLAGKAAGRLGKGRWV